MMNKFLVSVQGEDIVFLRDIPKRLNKEDALLLAAYIVALSDDRNEDRLSFEKILEKVQNT